MAGVPRALRMLAVTASIFFGGVFTLSLASSVVVGALQSAADANKKKHASKCDACKGTGFYPCKLCKGKSTIDWSPLFDPVAINPCLCPTCDGNKVQRCLNCLGKGYA